MPSQYFNTGEDKGSPKIRYGAGLMWLNPSCGCSSEATLVHDGGCYYRGHGGDTYGFVSMYAPRPAFLTCATLVAYHLLSISVFGLVAIGTAFSGRSTHHFARNEPAQCRRPGRSAVQTRELTPPSGDLPSSRRLLDLLLRRGCTNGCARWWVPPSLSSATVRPGLCISTHFFRAIRRGLCVLSQLQQGQGEHAMGG